MPMPMHQLFPDKTISAVCVGLTYDGHPCVLVATADGHIVEMVATGVAHLDARVLADPTIPED